MVTSEYIDVDENGKMMNCSPLSYKIPNVRSIPRKFNVTLVREDTVPTQVYSAKVNIILISLASAKGKLICRCIVNRKFVLCFVIRSLFVFEKVKVGNDQEMAQPERISHSKNRGVKKRKKLN